MARLLSRRAASGWSGPTEYRKVAVMSQGQFSKRIFGEPRDGIVFAWRDVDRRPRPRFDQPDPHFERVATNFLHGRTRWRRDVDAQLLSKFSSKCRARHFPGLHVPTGQVPAMSYRRPPRGSRSRSRAWRPSDVAHSSSVGFSRVPRIYPDRPLMPSPMSLAAITRHSTVMITALWALIQSFSPVSTFSDRLPMAK